MNDFLKELEGLFRERGFSTHRELAIEGARFDLVAEDDFHLIFVSLRTNNRGWRDDFYSQQAALDSAISGVRLGRKWRDVYLVHLTTDPVNEGFEFAAVQEIQSNTATARKFVVDAAGINLADRAQLEQLLAQVLVRQVTPAPTRDFELFDSLTQHLVSEGLDRSLVERLIADHARDGHKVVDILLDAAHDETEEP